MSAETASEEGVVRSTFGDIDAGAGSLLQAIAGGVAGAAFTERLARRRARPAAGRGGDGPRG